MAGLIIVGGICFVVLCYFVGWKLGDLEKRVSTLEGQMMIAATQIKDLDKVEKDKAEREAYLQYVVENVNSANGLLSYEDWIKGYNCGGYHD